MTDEIRQQFDSIETEDPSIHKLDKKLTLMIINVNDMLEKYHELDTRQSKVEKKLVWAQGWVAGVGILVTVIVFFFVKLWEKVFS